MDRQEKMLYHQMRPLKLPADSSPMLAVIYFGWRRRPAPALLASSALPGLASALLMRYADLEPLKESRAGRYMRQYMMPAMLRPRATVAGVIFLGAWSRHAGLALAGLLIVLAGWSGGLLAAARRPARH
jgi:hypothetical protein